MAIWLRQATLDAPGNVGAAGDVISGRTFAAMMQLDDGYRQLAADCEALLEEARAQAEDILDEARERAAEIEEEARELHATASERGYESGREAALADWFDSAASAAEVQQRLHERMRERFAHLVMAAAEQVIGAESRAALLARATTAVETIVEQATYLKVKVHPDDLEAAQVEFGRLAERRREAGAPLPLTVAADHLLTPGSCLCETDIGTADASLETQLRAMRLAVERALGGPLDDTSPLSALAEKLAGEERGAPADREFVPDAPARGGRDEATMDDEESMSMDDGAQASMDDDEPMDDEALDDVDAWMRELNGDDDDEPPRGQTRHAYED
jgi:type III secretion protein L